MEQPTPSISSDAKPHSATRSSSAPPQLAQAEQSRYRSGFHKPRSDDERRSVSKGKGKSKGGALAIGRGPATFTTEVCWHHLNGSTWLDSAWKLHDGGSERRSYTFFLEAGLLLVRQGINVHALPSMP